MSVSSTSINVQLSLIHDQSAIVFFFINYAYAVTSTRGDGWEGYIYDFSTVSFSFVGAPKPDVNHRPWLLPASWSPMSITV
jgi:hypothetical protein